MDNVLPVFTIVKTSLAVAAAMLGGSIADSIGSKVPSSWNVEQDWAQDNTPYTSSQPAVFMSRPNHAIKCHVLRKLFSIGTHALREVTACTTGSEERKQVT